MTTSVADPSLSVVFEQLNKNIPNKIEIIIDEFSFVFIVGIYSLSNGKSTLLVRLELAKKKLSC